MRMSNRDRAGKDWGAEQLEDREDAAEDAVEWEDMRLGAARPLQAKAKAVNLTSRAVRIHWSVHPSTLTLKLKTDMRELRTGSGRPFRRPEE